MTPLNTLQDLLVDQLQDVYDAENQLIQALPSMMAAATHVELKEAFRDHLEETHEQVARLREIFGILAIPVVGRRCMAMQGLIRESEEVLNHAGNSDVIDAALIAAAQRIEHYEIAAYGTMKAFAKRLNLKEVVKLVEATLEEEGSADKKLTKVAEGGIFSTSINKEAAKI